MTDGQPSPRGVTRQQDASPTVTDLAELQRRSRDLERQTLRFRRWVKFDCDLTDEQLDALVRETADEVCAHVDCASCGRCCHIASIAVDDADIARLARRLDTTPAAFRQRYVRMVEGEPGLIGGPCRFLRGTRCTVYDDRPASCRDFPYLHSAGFRQRMLFLVDLSPFCPIVFNTLEALKRRLPWRRAGAGASARRARRSG